MINRNNILHIFGSLFAGGALLSSCVADDPVIQDNSVSPDKTLRAEVTLEAPEISEFPKGMARIAKNNEDHYSYGNSTGGAGFTVGDEVGVFARSGNLSKDNGYGPIINEKMVYELTSYTDQGSGTDQQSYNFVSETMEIYTGAIQRNTSVFMYYPYSPDMGTYENYKPDPHQITTGNGYPNNYNMMSTTDHPYKGVKLRQNFTMEDGTTQERCIDILKMTSVDAGKLANGILSGTFYHTFSELILMRGEGFDKPINEEGDEDYSITVTLKNPYTHAQVVSSGYEVQWTIRLVCDETLTPEEKEKAKIWEAWKGDNFKKVNETSEGREAYYVVLPTGDNSSVAPRSEVYTLNLYDNYGNYQHVSSFILNSNVADGTNNNGQYSYNRNNIPDKKPIYRVRYPLIIAMDEIEPVVRPFTIQDWNDSEGNNITDARTSGIESADEYREWATAYNSWINGGRQTPDDDDELYQYGNYDITNNVWHFYINGNEKGVIDFGNQAAPYVSSLQDVIEGTNLLFNITLQNIKMTTPLFGEIRGKGGITNLNFKNIDIRSDSNGAIGCLATTITGTAISANVANGFIENVNIINGTVIGNAGVGILAGSMSDGLIRNCSFSGFIMGTSTAGQTSGVLDHENYNWTNLLGTTPESGKIPYTENVDFNDVMFTNY